MLELVVACGDGLEPAAHGLIGTYGTPSDTTRILSVFIELGCVHTLKILRNSLLYLHFQLLLMWLH